MVCVTTMSSIRQNKTHDTEERYRGGEGDSYSLGGDGVGYEHRAWEVFLSVSCGREESEWGAVEPYKPLQVLLVREVG